MTKKSFIIILVLSLVVTYIISIAESILMGTLIAGSAGLPFKFASGTLFGEANTNYLFLVLDVIFWFIALWMVWKLAIRIIRK